MEQFLEQPDETGRDFVVWPGIRVGREALRVGLWRDLSMESGQGRMGLGPWALQAGGHRFDPGTLHSLTIRKSPTCCDFMS
jgi:hypothetical protein